MTLERCSEIFFAELKQRVIQEALKPRSFNSIRKRITHFIKTLGKNTPITALTLTDLTNYLLHPASAGNYNTWLQHLKTFLNFCTHTHEWLPKNPADKLKLRKTKNAVATFTPKEITQLLKGTYHLDGKEGIMMRTWLALGVFAGIRPGEIDRIKWDMLRTEEGKIALPASVTKTGVPRKFPMEPNLKAWLQTCNPGEGLVYNAKNHREQFARMLAAAHFPRKNWKQDGLRHTYGSAMFVLCDNLPMVAHHMGNKEEVCKKHYLATEMSETTARAIFAILPPDTASDTPPHDS